MSHGPGGDPLLKDSVASAPIVDCDRGINGGDGAASQGGRSAAFAHGHTGHGFDYTGHVVDLQDVVQDDFAVLRPRDGSIHHAGCLFGSGIIGRGAVLGAQRLDDEVADGCVTQLHPAGGGC